MKIRPIILAAGKSQRFGENKLLYTVNGKPLFRHIFDVVFKLYQENFVLEPIFVTNNEQLQQQLAQLNAKFVVNENSQNGISTSIQKGLDVTPISENEGMIFFTADQPFVTEECIKGFINGFLVSGKGLGCVCHEDITGNPCIFLNQYRDELYGLKGDVGGKKIIKSHSEDVFFYNVEKSLMLVDIDTKEDLNKI